MRSLIFLVTIFSILSVSNISLAKDSLNKSQKEKALIAIDNFCGAVWCENDYDFSFDKITCSKRKKECVVEFKMFDIDFTKTVDGTEGEQYIRRTMLSGCTVTGIKRFYGFKTGDRSKRDRNSIFSFDGEWEISEDFTNKLSVCIRKEMAEFRRLEGWLDGAIAVK